MNIPNNKFFGERLDQFNRSSVEKGTRLGEITRERFLHSNGVVGLIQLDTAYSNDLKCTVFAYVGFLLIAIPWWFLELPSKTSTVVRVEAIFIPPHCGCQDKQ